MPVMRTGGPLHEVPKEVDGETHIRDTGEGVDIYKNLKATDANGMRPVKLLSASVDAPVAVPDEVDADLEGKSDYVKAAVMARRNELKKAQEARLAEVAEREAKEARESAEIESVRAAADPKLKDWALEPGGAPKNVRLLISTLQNVLWEGSGWEPVPMAKLVIPQKVKAFYLRAVTKVHPDKQAGMDSAAQRYIAGQVFHYLERAWRDFQEKELGQ